MKASWEKSEKNEGVLTIEVDQSQVDEALDKAFKKIVKQVNVPGFRKGKVPRRIFEAKFGVESLYQDALDIILPEAYSEAINETKIEPIAQPEIDFEEFNKGQAFTFTAKVQVKPEVELGEYKGIVLDPLDNSVSDEEIQEELTQMQQRHAELIVLEEGEAEQGDTAIIDFEGFLDGEAFEGGKGENHSLELGSGSFIPGFEEQVIGLRKGDLKDITVTFPEDYQAENLAGKEAVFKVQVHDIKRKVLPELDDEFAKDVSEFETLEEYKQDLQKTIQSRKEHEYEHYCQNTVVEKATEAASVEVPEPMIETETNNMLQDFENRLRQQGMTLDIYYQISGQDEAAMKEQMRGDAEIRVKQNLVLEAISKAENVSVTAEEIDEELGKLAEMYQMSAEEIKKILTDNGNLENIEKDIIIRKTIDLLIDQSEKSSEKKAENAKAEKAKEPKKAKAPAAKTPAAKKAKEPKEAKASEAVDEATDEATGEAEPSSESEEAK